MEFLTTSPLYRMKLRHLEGLLAQPESCRRGSDSRMARRVIALVFYGQNRTSGIAAKLSNKNKDNTAVVPRLPPKAALVLPMVLLMAGAWPAGSVELGLARMPLVPVRRPEKQEPYWVPVMEPAWSEQVRARVSGSVSAMLWPPPRRGRRAA